MKAFCMNYLSKVHAKGNLWIFSYFWRVGWKMSGILSKVNADISVRTKAFFFFLAELCNITN